ncbi:basic phospholipase A2 PA-12A [Haemaphysalis longicornis]
MSQLTWAKKARGPLRLALILGLALLTLILAGVLAAMSERRALSRRRPPGASGSPLSGQRQGSSKGVPLLVKVPSPGEENGRHRAGARARRSIVQLANMLKCVSGCNPLSYRGYGCFCGYMGDGTPVDHIDSCCLEHDWCYSQSPCSKLSLYLLPYDWHCLTPGMAHCAHPSSLSPHAHCGQQLCQCDLEFANCVSRYPCPRRRVSCQHSKFAALHTFLHGKKR